MAISTTTQTDAVPVDVIVKGNQVKVVAIESGRVLHRVTLLGRTLPEGSIPEYVVNGRTLSQGRSAPADLKKDANGFDLPIALDGTPCPVAPPTARD